VYNSRAMQIFRLFWLRETGCDAGTPLRADQLEPQLQSPELQKKIVELAAAASGEVAFQENASGEVTLRLPYLEQREWRRRGEILSALRWERQGCVISPVLPAAAALRNTAAHFALRDPLWIEQPPDSDARHFAAWRDVSVTLQRRFREWISDEYFRDPVQDRLADREAAFSMIVYHAARVCHGRSRGPFTYDLRDYPECRLTLALATKMTGRSIQAVLAGLEDRLRTAGMPELARRYAPVWYQDVVLAVRKKPKAFIALLTAESVFIDALVELNLNKTTSGVHHFSKIANQALRKVYGMDLRHLGIRALEESALVLARHAAGIVP
jgi:hypothetical protein